MQQSSTSKYRFRTASGGSAVAPLGPETIQSLKRLYNKAIPTWEKPSISIALKKVSQTKLDVEDIASKSLPSIVMLKNDRSTGSGFILGKNTILTNRHVVSGRDPTANHFAIRVKNGRRGDLYR